MHRITFSEEVAEPLLLQDDLEAELLDSPEEREPVGAGKNRRDFGTCQVERLTRLRLTQADTSWSTGSPGTLSCAVR